MTDGQKEEEALCKSCITTYLLLLHTHSMYSLLGLRLVNTSNMYIVYIEYKQLLKNSSFNFSDFGTK